jgi:MarR family transcriptional repressor of emrRAB
MRLEDRFPGLPIQAMLFSRLAISLGRKVTALLERHIHRSGLQEPAFRVLTTLYSQPGGAAHPSQLCTITGLSPTNISRISDALVGRDLITRSPSLVDRRRRALQITARGESLVRNILPTLFATTRPILRGCSEQEQVRLIGHLKLIAVGLAARKPAAAPIVLAPSPNSETT